MDASYNPTITGLYLTFLNSCGNTPNINIMYKLYRRIVLLVDKMADQNLPGYQPRKFIESL